ncbi:unnamed protein product [Bursaphelenchus okinawaensis]|uniref:EGF-like domain-containing protein n=1 Tax=Bursaphelenchus okinawaensis TaxID=465554 RepID=A0A811KNY4_9BILA|nr:unnamed protein product [Bursaphelenchus okinawaensis]CAG9106987.1 unnamed protein product [Bursaphelenchus okinawaensis]
MRLPLIFCTICLSLSLSNELSDELPVCNCSSTTPDYYYDLHPVPDIKCRPCFEGSQCVQEQTGATCQCAPFRFGTYCQYADLCHNGRSQCVGDCKESFRGRKCVCNEDKGGEFCEFQKPKQEILLTFEVTEPQGVQNVHDGLDVLTKAAHLGGFEVLDDGKAIYKSSGNLCMKEKIDQNRDIDVEDEDFEPYQIIIKARLLMACGRLAEHHHTEIFTCYTSAYDAVHTLGSLRLYEQTKRFGLNFIHVEVDHSILECQHIIALIISILAILTIVTTAYCLYQRISYRRRFRGSGAHGTGSGDTMNKLIEPNGYF